MGCREKAGKLSSLFDRESVVWHFSQGVGKRRRRKKKKGREEGIIFLLLLLNPWGTLCRSCVSRKRRRGGKDWLPRSIGGREEQRGTRSKEEEEEEEATKKWGKERGRRKGGSFLFVSLLISSTKESNKRGEQ